MVIHGDECNLWLEKSLHLLMFTKLPTPGERCRPPLSTFPAPPPRLSLLLIFPGTSRLQPPYSLFLHKVPWQIFIFLHYHLCPSLVLKVPLAEKVEEVFCGFPKCKAFSRGNLQIRPTPLWPSPTGFSSPPPRSPCLSPPPTCQLLPPPLLHLPSPCRAPPQ